ncbi:MAG: putative toxin-antitoxin system toxin component, PIN family [Steroidobacteraceae bacterium]
MLRKQLRKQAGESLRAIWQRLPQEEPTDSRDRAKDRRRSAHRARRARRTPQAQCQLIVRLLLGTNVIVAALLWAGPPRRLLEKAIDDDRLVLYSTPKLIDEFAHTLRYPKFANRIARYATTPAALVAQYTALVTLLSPIRAPRVVEQDADDDHVIAAALAARAELIGTGDRRHLLPIGSHQDVAIITAAEALLRIAAQDPTE